MGASMTSKRARRVLLKMWRPMAGSLKALINAGRSGRATLRSVLTRLVLRNIWAKDAR